MSNPRSSVDWGDARRPILRKYRDIALADQSVASATPTNVDMPTTAHNLPDKEGRTFTVVSNSLWTPPKLGLYLTVAQITFQGAASTGAALRRIVSLYNNTDAVTVAQNILPSLQSAGQPLVISMPVIEELDPSKQYAIRVRQDSGGALGIGFGFTSVSVMWLGPSS